MLRWLAACVLLCLTAFVAVALATGKLPHTALTDTFVQTRGPSAPSGEAPETSKKNDSNTKEETNKKETVGAVSDRDEGTVIEFKDRAPVGPSQQEPVVINDGRVAVIDYQEVPSERDGQLLFVARELTRDDGPLLEVVDKASKIQNPNERNALLTANGLVEERITYLHVLLSENEAKVYGALADNLNWQFENDHTRTYRRWVENMSPPALRPNQVYVVPRVEYMKRIQVGDWVEKGQRLALIKPDLAVADLEVKVTKLNVAEAERKEAEKTKELFQERLENYKKYPNSASKEDISSTQLQVVRYDQEELSKKESIKQAESELKAALTTVRLHDVRARISGVVRTIYKNPGDAVKNLEPVLRIESPARLRVEGLVEVPEGRKLRVGMKAVVEATRPDSPMLVLRGHMQEVHGVAVCPGKANESNTIIVSGSEDKKLCGWDPTTGAKRWEVKYAAGVRAVACTGPKAARRFVAAGTADGAVRLLDLDHISDKAVILSDPAVDADSPRAHSAPVTSIAFSPDGTLVATGGEDYAVALWEVPSGKPIARMPKAHKQAVTSVQIIETRLDKDNDPVVGDAQNPGLAKDKDAQPQRNLRLLSAGRDNVLSLWTITDGKMLTRDRDFDRRSGEVGLLTSDGKRFLFDQGKELRLLSLTDGQLEGMLQNPPTAGTFTTLALFAPDGQTVLTNGTGDTGLQLWRAPEGRGRGSEVRQFTWSDGRATCAAFAPDGSFAVTGTREDHQVLVWKMPSKDEVQTRLSAKVSLVEETVESGSKQLRIWADLEKKPDWLMPGTKARMVLLPVSK